MNLKILIYLLLIFIYEKKSDLNILSGLDKKVNIHILFSIHKIQLQMK